ncbi:uncharacterized protein MONBRDRAFT_38204 [Monosiga brevicollis MX1]|uniref:Uncharacterized protein n=1 Tax=Monosiga brevicollis TaxID=81824 RepID=A9V6A4_MONBE|nr:uncharacterized protein MONBRDRAFT_38204 [Monosiga brevicollis MX1]EDQ87034.1 predicted protein [Monosiga brevicollis MX1]|eukprot:XP_001748273.1 hypothetical protein [Monosiga brevicollis MX1]
MAKRNLSLTVAPLTLVPPTAAHNLKPKANTKPAGLTLNLAAMNRSHSMSDLSSGTASIEASPTMTSSHSSSSLSSRRGFGPLSVNTIKTRQVVNDEDLREEAWTPEELDFLFESHTPDLSP